MITARTTIAIAALTLCLCAPVSAQKPSAAQATLKAATDKEMIDGDLKGAIALFEKAVSQAKSDPATSAKALVGLGRCYEELGNADARKVYERVVRDFADQSESVDLARARLLAISSPKNRAQTVRQVWIASNEEDVSESAPSPDGRYIGLTQWDTGDLAVRDLASGITRRLTHSDGWEKSGEWAEGSVISPDGRQIAYFWNSPEGTRSNELRVLPISGGTPRTVYRTNGFHNFMSLYGWSPDGKRILAEYTTSEAHRQIVMVTVEDGALHVVKDLSQRAQSLTLSPDGRFIAYDSAPDDKTIAKDVFVLAVDGSHESPIVDGKSDDYAPVWSPDGSRLLFMSDRTGTHSLWTVSVEQGKASGPFELLKPDLGRIHPLGMTRGGVLLYLPSSSNRTNVYSADLGRDGKVAQVPLRVTDRFLNTNMGTTLSPDGRYLGYFSNRPGAPVLVVRTLATGDERAVTWPLANGPFFGAGPDFFPDNGAVLAFAREGQSGFGLYRVDLANGNPELLVRIKQGGFQGYSLSPDGRSIYYSCQDDASPNLSNHLVRYDLDTRQETELAKGEWFITVKVSPDGKQLAYLASIRPGSDSVIEVMPTSGGAAREIYRGSHWTDGSRYGTLAWSKDGLYVNFARGGSGGRNTLWRVPTSGGPAEQMGLSMQGTIKSPQFAPDGRHLYFGSNEAAPEEIWTLENFLSTQRAGK